MVQSLVPAWKSVPSTYVMCTNDRVLPLEAQRTMAAEADEIVEIDSDHSPFVLRAGELADVLVRHLPWRAVTACRRTVRCGSDRIRGPG